MKGLKRLAAAFVILIYIALWVVCITSILKYPKEAGGFALCIVFVMGWAYEPIVKWFKSFKT